MKIQLETIEVAALALPLSERAALTQHLPTLESGKMRAVALTEVTSRLRAAFK
jgi:hypothetical protein